MRHKEQALDGIRTMTTEGGSRGKGGMQETSIWHSSALSFFEGFQIAVVGSFVALSNPKFRKLYTGSVAILIFFIVCTFLLAGVLYIPFFLLNYVVSFVVNTGIQQQGFWAGMYDLLWQVSIFVPLATLGVYRLFSSTLIRWGDHAFFYTLDDIDAELSAELKRRKPIPVLQWFLIYMRRVARLLLLSSLIYLWSCLPYVGFLVPASSCSSSPL
ncbi:hypothetical protein QOT17_015312 [Balamuthia mandrillaris]